MPQKPINEEYTLAPYNSSENGLILNLREEKYFHPSLQEDTRPFSYETYSLEIHPPVSLDNLRVGQLPKDLPRCLDMPLRLAGDESYHLPKEWASLAPLLEQIIATEHAHNPNWREYHTYMTVDCSEVTKDLQQRRGGLHVDGFQGERINPKTKITRNYILTTNGGTIFYPQRFIVCDPKLYNVFHGFAIQTPGWERESGVAIEEDIVHFMNAYSVHESGLANKDGTRVFLRVTWDIKPFDRHGNTINKMLSCDWEMVARDTQENVISPDISHVESSPYFAINKARSLELPKGFMIGISGKPGAGKNWVALAILQELRFHGVNAIKSSIAKEVHNQARQIIKECQAGQEPDEIKRAFDLSHEQADKLLQVWSQDVGVEHSEYGFHRRNEFVRKGLELLSLIRRDQDTEYWLRRMLAKVPSDVVAVFSDLAFPNEADYVKSQGGMLVRINLDETWLVKTKGRNPGYKYSKEAMAHPVITALDEYKGFDMHAVATTFDAKEFLAKLVSRI